MKLKDKILLLPYVVILMFNIAVITIFGSSFLEGNYDTNGNINFYYLLFVCLVSLIILGLRILIVGKTTILDQYFKREKGDWLFIGFISFVVAILATTWAIKFFSISPFIIAFATDPGHSPLKWLDILNNNYHQLAFYALVFVLINAITLFVAYEVKKGLEESGLKIGDESIKTFLLIVMTLEIFLFLILFASDPMIFFWNKFLNLVPVKQILSYLFSGSLIFFNAFFLLKR